MQRVRIGLTGLAFVFLVVLLAAVFTGRPADEPPITPKSVDQQAAGRPPAPAIPPATEPTEPLAELGVAPGNAGSNTAVPTPGAQPPVQPQ